jgi:hypothetical protein
MPAPFTVAREMPSTHASVGGLVGGGGGGGGGLGVVGLLQVAASAKVTTNAERTAQYFTECIDMN